MIVARVTPSIYLTKSRTIIAPTFKRYLNAPPSTGAETNDAFLEPVEGRPGVSYLSLNRPKAKNAVGLSDHLWQTYLITPYLDLSSNARSTFGKGDGIVFC